MNARPSRSTGVPCAMTTLSLGQSRICARLARGAAVGEGEPELARHGGLGLRHQIQPRDQRPPAGEPAGRELLQQVGEQHRAAGAMEEHRLGGDRVAGHQHVVEVARPVARRRIPKLDIDAQVGPFGRQPRRGVQPNGRERRAPLRQMQVMQRIGRDQDRDLAQRRKLRGQVVVERYRRPDQQAAAGQADHRHPRRIAKPGDLRLAAVREPDLGPERA